MENETKNFRLGVLGAGHVGSGFIRAAAQRNEHLKSSGLGTASVDRVLVRDLSKSRDLPIPSNALTTSAEDIVGNSEIDIVISLLGGKQPEERYIRQALKSGQHVITANKAVIAAYGADLERVAWENGVALLYEAAVGGGLPSIRALKSHFIPNGVVQIEAILNGTCNFILTEMARGLSFDDALSRAQKLGLAEADPTMDISGRDSAQKLAILATMIFGVLQTDETVFCRGVERLDAVDLRFARDRKLALILLASGYPNREAGCTLSVMPMFVSQSSGLARCAGPDNVMRLETISGGSFESFGLGAGGAPTAMSVMSDLAAVMSGAWRGEYPRLLADAAVQKLGALPYPKERHAWYVRLSGEERAIELLNKLTSQMVNVKSPAPAVLEIAGVTYRDLIRYIGGDADTAAIVQFHRSLRPHP